MTCCSSDLTAECLDMPGLNLSAQYRGQQYSIFTVKALPNIESSEGARECWRLCGEPFRPPLAIQ